MGQINIVARPVKYMVQGPGTSERGEGFCASPMRYSTIDVKELAEHIAADSRVERSKVSVITDSLIKQVQEMVLNGHSIRIPHLGILKPGLKSKVYDKMKAVTGAEMSAKLMFIPSTEIKNDLKSIRIKKVELPKSAVTPDPEP